MAFIKEIFMSQLTDSHATDKEGIGRLRFEDDGKIYRYVKNSDTSSGLAATYPVCHTVANATDVTYVQHVKLPLTANLSSFAGIVSSTTMTVSSGATPYGWIQIAGVATTPLGVGTLTAGQLLIPANSAAYMASDGTNNSYNRGAQLINTSTSTSSGSTSTSVLLKNLL
jgi:hypothetical protein